MSKIQTTEFNLSGIGDQFSGVIELMSRRTTLADQPFKQYWVSKQGLFGTRRKRSGNHAAILDFYNQLCVDRNKDRHEMSAKVHLLASLLPLVRSNKAQNIFPDASTLQPKECLEPSEFNPEALEVQLRKSKSARISVVDFCNRNRDAVDFPCFSASTFELYREFEAELFCDVPSRWYDDAPAAKVLVEQRWMRWCNGFGRRRGNKEKKDVLNILSYESKAAFTQCYSALWVEMIPHLLVGQENPDFCRQFHTLWHLDHRIPVPGSERPVNLLHGLALGLHPSFGMLLTTETGSRLVGETVAMPRDIEAQERFLHAGLVSLYLYATARQFRSHRIS